MDFVSVMGMVVLFTIGCMALYYALEWLDQVKLRLIWAILKMVVAVPLLPVFVLLFLWDTRLFLNVFSFFWVHLDILDESKELYLRRFFLTPKTRFFRPWFLHFICKSDVGRESHDHPGAFTSWPLKNGYDEQIYHPLNQKFRDTVGFYEVREVRVGMKVENPVGHTHKVNLIGPTWTLVRAWIRGKPWGFWLLSDSIASQDRWVESNEYGVKGDEVKSWA